MLIRFEVITAIIGILSGIYVLARGDWRKFGLKFAGIALSTSAAIWLFFATIFLGDILACQAQLAANVCLTFEIYHIIRNVAFIIFHIAIGRDAIQFKQRDRRGTLCQKNLSRRPRPW